MTRRKQHARVQIEFQPVVIAIDGNTLSFGKSPEQRFGCLYRVFNERVTLLVIGESRAVRQVYDMR